MMGEKLKTEIARVVVCMNLGDDELSTASGRVAVQFQGCVDFREGKGGCSRRCEWEGRRAGETAGVSAALANFGPRRA
jgi:hypothetical protein